jgi:hypothetical protein
MSKAGTKTLLICIFNIEGIIHCKFVPPKPLKITKSVAAQIDFFFYKYSAPFCKALSLK